MKIKKSFLQIIGQWTVGFFRHITTLLCCLIIKTGGFFAYHFLFLCFTDGSEQFLMVFLLLERCLLDIVHELCAPNALQRVPHLCFVYPVKRIIIIVPSCTTG